MLSALKERSSEILCGGADVSMRRSTEMDLGLSKWDKSVEYKTERRTMLEY